MSIQIILQLFVLPIIIGIVASFVAWLIPAEKFRPKIVGIRYNQIINEDVKNVNEKVEKRATLQRHIEIQNLSSMYAAYNIFYRFEFYDNKGQNVYFEGDIYPYIAANSGTISIPLRTIPVDKMSPKNIVRGQLQLIYENRYGTKKKSDTYHIEEYTIDKKSYELIKSKH